MRAPRKRVVTADGNKPAPRPIYAGVLGKVRQVVDGVVNTFAPTMALEMRKSRIKSANLLAYEAARVTRVTPKQESGSADSEILPDLPALRAGARNMVRDDAHAAAGKRVYEDNVVGKGIVPQAICTAEDTGLSEEEVARWNRDCEREWARWSDEVADATWHGSFYDLQRMAAGAMLPEGELIGHAVLDGDEIRCELIDPDRLESPGHYDQLRLRGGVELGPLGEPIAYHVLNVHPSERWYGASSKPIRIAARSGALSIVQHVFRRERAGQTRGVPWLVPSLNYSGHLHHYLNSELIAARANSNVAMFVRRAPDVNDPNIMPVESPDGGVETYHETLEAGIIEYLNEGEEIQPFIPNRPGTQFEPFVRRILRAIWAAPGLAYELVTKDFGSMNYSSARALLLECRRSFDVARLLIVRRFCRPWWSNVIHTAIEHGRLRAPRGFEQNPRAFLAARWVPPAYGWVDPTKEIDASRAAVENLLSTPYDEAARAGLDAEEAAMAKARYVRFCRDLEERMGLAPGSVLAMGPAQAPAAPAAADPADDPDDEQPDDDPAGDPEQDPESEDEDEPDVDDEETP